MAGWVRRQWELVCGLVLVGGFCCLLAVPRLIIRLVFQYYPLPSLGVGIAAVVTVAAVARARRRRLAAWAARGDWTQVSVATDWPWRSLVRLADSVVVARAWRSTVDGFPVVAGEISWDRNALDGAVGTPAGRGVFVVIRLPRPAEPMAMRRPSRTIGTSDRLDRPALHDAFENGEIPPWTVRDQELFTFQATTGRLRPASLDDLVRSSLRVVDLLDLGPHPRVDR